VKEKLIVWLVSIMMQRLKSEDMKKWIDQGLDMLEDKIAETPNKTDDLVLLPLIGIMRDAMSIPDND
jgi:hypothetical protein